MGSQSSDDSSWMDALNNIGGIIGNTGSNIGEGWKDWFNNLGAPDADEDTGSEGWDALRDATTQKGIVDFWKDEAEKSG